MEQKKKMFLTFKIVLDFYYCDICVRSVRYGQQKKVHGNLTMNSLGASKAMVTPGARVLRSQFGSRFFFRYKDDEKVESTRAPSVIF